MGKFAIFILFLLAVQLYGQQIPVKKETHFTIENEMKNLTEFISLISWEGSADNLSGIFQRRIQKIDVDQTETYSKLHKFLPYLELNYIHLRFSDFDSVRLDKNGTPFAIGKVFMSERYIESDYYDRFRQATDYQNDRDGFYYYCKVYFDSKNIEQRLVIYPHFLSNICKKYMHLNNETCPDVTGRTIHDRSIRALIAIPDTYYGDFLSENSYNTPSELHRNLEKDVALFATQNPGSDVNFRPALLQAGGSDGFKVRMRKNSLSVFINHTKYMKIFRITTEIESSGRIANALLTLIHSKKTDSEDFSDNLHYDYTFLRYNEKPLSQPISEFVEFTNNAANRRLIFSEKPDDEFVPGKKRVFNQISFTSDGNQGIDGCRNDPAGFINCIQSIKNELVTLNARLAIRSDSLSTALSPLNKQLLTAISDEKEKQKSIIKDSITSKINERADLTSLRKTLKTNFLSAQHVQFLMTDTTTSVSRDSVEAFMAKISSIELGLTARNNGILTRDLNIAHEKDLVNKLSSTLARAATDTGRAIILKNYKPSIISKLREIENIANASIQKRERIVDGEIGAYKNLARAYTEEKPVNTIRSKTQESPELTALHAVYQNKMEQLNMVRDSLKQLSQDLKKIDREIIGSRVDLSKISGFIYVDPVMEEKYKELESSAETTRLKYFYNLFQNSFYVRKSLPEMLPDSIYFKGEISEIYEPFNFNKAEVKNRFRALAPPGTSWKKSLRDSVASVLANNLWSPVTEITGYDSTLYTRGLKTVALYKIVDPKTGYFYFWLRIPQTAVELVPYMNYFFNKRPKQRRPWKIKYKDEDAAKR